MIKHRALDRVDFLKRQELNDFLKRQELNEGVARASATNLRLEEERSMHAVIRTYSGQGAQELFDLLERRKSDVESLMRSAKGFVSYSLVRTGDGGITITVCHDKAGTDDSIQKARDWIGQNASDIGASAPKVTDGPVILHVK